MGNQRNSVPKDDFLIYFLQPSIEGKETDQGKMLVLLYFLTVPGRQIELAANSTYFVKEELVYSIIKKQRHCFI